MSGHLSEGLVQTNNIGRHIMTHYWIKVVVNIKALENSWACVQPLPRKKPLIIIPCILPCLKSHKERKKIKYFYLPTMMAVDLYSGLKGQRLRPSSITISPTSSLSSVNVDVFWRRDTKSKISLRHRPIKVYLKQRVSKIKRVTSSSFCITIPVVPLTSLTLNIL